MTCRAIPYLAGTCCGADDSGRVSRSLRMATIVPFFVGVYSSVATAAGEHRHLPFSVHSPSVVGDLRLHTLTSKVLANTRNLRVLVPDGYDDPTNRTRRYAVLYMADGQNLFDPATSVFARVEWRVDETVHQLVADGRIPPMIVVGVDDAGAQARDHEYLPWPDTVSAHVNPAYDPNPQGKRYPEFLIDEVMPYINSRYRTLHDPDHTGIGGSSYGGLISTYVVMARPGVFGRLLAESPVMHVYDFQLFKDVPAVKAWPGRVYLGVGTNEGGEAACEPGPVPTLADTLHGIGSMVYGVLRFAEFLRVAGVDSSRVRVVIAPCGTHTAGAWAARLPAALTFLFGGDRH